MFPFTQSLGAIAHMHEKAEQASTYLHSWLTSLRKVNTFPTLPDSLPLALSTSSRLHSSKPLRPSDQHPGCCLLQHNHSSHAQAVLHFETKPLCVSTCDHSEGKVSRNRRGKAAISNSTLQLSSFSQETLSEQSLAGCLAGQTQDLDPSRVQSTWITASPALADKWLKQVIWHWGRAGSTKQCR